MLPTLTLSIPDWALVSSVPVEREYQNRDKAKQLDPVGGRIVAETFAGPLTEDSQSFVGQNPRWTPTIGDGKTFGTKGIFEVCDCEVMNGPRGLRKTVVLAESV
jgi:hypothetical protein